MLCKRGETETKSNKVREVEGEAEGTLSGNKNLNALLATKRKATTNARISVASESMLGSGSVLSQHFKGLKDCTRHSVQAYS